MLTRSFVLFCLLNLSFCINKQELLDHLKHLQDTRTTFDSRIRQADFLKPIGYVGGKPIWPRVLDKVRSPGELFFDDDNFAYAVHDRTPAGLIRKMDRETNFNKVIKFLNKYT